MDNKKDVAIIDTALEQKKMGIAIAKGVLKTLGIKWVAEKKYSITISGLEKAEANRLLKDLKDLKYNVKLS